MLITIGTRLGPYEIVAPLGAGGMGEVYRARDTRLGREVAVKVLPRHLSSNPEVRARFEREAKTVSSLNHPHICVLHDVGREGDTDFLVMELVEGETLAQRLAKGPLPLPEVLRLGAQIAEALGRAHRAGVVHRDLKPGNVMLARSGAKLMDFGLARATGMAGPASGSGATVLALTQSPTIAQPLTAEGTIVGTFQYMAPEQLEGKEADARADIWALGCVLYEMATGRRAFEGQSQASLISSIMKDEPRPLRDVVAVAPPALDRLVRECLAKDPDQRVQSAHDVRVWLDAIHDMATPADAASAAPSARRGRLLWMTAGALLLVVLAAVWVAAMPGRDGEPAPGVHATVSPPDGVSYAKGANRPLPLAVSPDGRRIAFVGARGQGPYMLWVRSLDAPDARVLEGTEDAQMPFFSPDGRSLGFFTRNALKKVDVNGGPVVTLASVTDPRGGSWGAGGEIVYAPGSESALYRVSPDGGRPVAVTTLDSTVSEQTHRFPHWLPDGKHFLYLARRQGVGAGEEPTIFAGSLDGKFRRAVLGAASNVAFASGHLLFVRGGVLMAQPFDPGRLETRGPAVPIVDDLQWEERFSRGVFAASSNGVLAFVTGQTSTLVQLQWRDRSGRALGRVGEPADYTYGGTPMISPDGRHAAMCILNSARGLSDVWIVDLATGQRRRLTGDGGDYPGCAWSSDGRHVFMTASVMSDGNERIAIVSRAVDGGDTDTLLTSEAWLWPLGQGPDGRYVLVGDDGGAGGHDVYAVPAGGGALLPIAVGPEHARQGQVSPDGRWVAYTSFESGRAEVYVTAFPGLGDRWQVSKEGGIDPRWSRNGRELFFIGRQNYLTAVEIRASAAGFETGAAQPLFQLADIGGDWRYDAAPDGQRFLTLGPAENEPAPTVTVMTRWTEKLRKP